MAGKKRERELQRQRYQRARTRERQHAARRRRTNTIVGAVVAVLVVAGGASYAGVALSGGGTAKKTAASATPSSANPTPSSSTEAFSGHCTYTPEKDAQHAKNVGLPPSKVSDPSRQRATIETNRGTISATLLGKQAPCTVNSFSFLASKNFFDGTPCHRLTTKGIFVLQCGDPSGTGAGGPGYGFANENLDAFTGKSGSSQQVTYPAGTIAMAHSSKPNSNGSQFFIVYKDSPLAPQYTPFGRVTSGLDTVAHIAKKGVAGGGTDGKPAAKVKIKNLTVESPTAAAPSASTSPSGTPSTKPSATSS